MLVKLATQVACYRSKDSRVERASFGEPDPAAPFATWVGRQGRDSRLKQKLHAHLRSRPFHNAHKAFANGDFTGLRQGLSKELQGRRRWGHLRRIFEVSPEERTIAPKGQSGEPSKFRRLQRWIFAIICWPSCLAACGAL